jgi:hypothetical protein
VSDEQEQVAEPSSVERLIDQWFADHFHGSPIARDNEHYQHAWGAKEALKRLLKGHQS